MERECSLAGHAASGTGPDHLPGNLRAVKSPETQRQNCVSGGTAINKLLFEKPLRYSEDIDLVQVETGPI